MSSLRRQEGRGALARTHEVRAVPRPAVGRWNPRGRTPVLAPPAGHRGRWSNEDAIAGRLGQGWRLMTRDEVPELIRDFVCPNGSPYPVNKGRAFMLLPEERAQARDEHHAAQYLQTDREIRQGSHARRMQGGMESDQYVRFEDEEVSTQSGVRQADAA